MKQLALIGTVLAVLATPATAATTRCRNAQGRFIACAHAPAAPAGGITRDANGRCRQAGKFVKCPAAAH